MENTGNIIQQANDYSTDFSDSLVNADSSPVAYRFSGYQLPKEQLDSTGKTYVVTSPHPYFYNQPEGWTKPAYQDGRLIEPSPTVLGLEQSNGPIGVFPSDNPSNPANFQNQQISIQQNQQKNTSNLFRLSNF